jgi:hypothetical protein
LLRTFCIIGEAVESGQQEECFVKIMFSLAFVTRIAAIALFLLILAVVLVFR